MKLLHLALSFAPGGRREAITTLVMGLARCGLRCDLTCVEKLECESAVVEKIFLRSEELNRKVVGTDQAVSRLLRLCDDQKIELIHAHDGASQWMAAWLRLLRPRIKLVMTFHRTRGFESAGWRGKLRNAVAGLGTSTVVVGSRERRRHYLSENFVPTAKVVRIPFGVNLEKFRPDLSARAEVRRELGVAGNELLIGAVGHFGSEKGIDVAIRSFLAFLQRHPAGSPKLVVIGQGTPAEEGAMRELAAPGGEAVRFVGFRSDVERYFSAMDIFLHVPRLEAFGLVVAEAMACGRPVIGANVGGVTDMVREGETGLLVPPDQPTAAADALSRLSDDRALQERLSAQALQVAQAEYSESLYARRHMDLYERILAGQRPRGVDQEGMPDKTQFHSFSQQSTSKFAREINDV